MTTALYTPPTVTPPAVPYGKLKSALVLARNPVEWWPQALYEGSSFAFRRRGRTFLLLTDPALVETVLLTEADSFERSFLTQLTLRPALGGGLLTADGDSWRAQRRIAAPAFRHQALTQLVPAMDRAAAAMVTRLKSAPGRTDMMAAFVDTTFDIILETVLGGAASRVDRDRNARDVAIYLETVGNPDVLDVLGWLTFLPRPWKWRGLAAARRMRAAITDALAAKAPGTADLAGLLIGARDPETGAPLSPGRLLDNAMTFLAAGHETTALALTWTASILGALPSLQEELAAEAGRVIGDGPVTAEAIERLDLHRRVIQEAMRLYPPAPLIVRNVVAPVRVGDRDLQPGDHVSIAIYPMHRNRRLWENPDAFDPDRFLPERAAGRHRFAWLPFGGGPRICIGLSFAMMEAVTVLAHLTRAIRLAPATDHRIWPLQRVTLRPEGGMPMIVQPR